MTAPVIKVEIGFAATASLGSNFVLDDATKGVLNNTSYTLADTVYVDVTQWCSGQINVNRGRSREVDQYQAGTLSFELRNEDRRFDPSNTASIYYPGIKPRARVNAYLAGVQIFGGYVDDLTVNYEKPSICTVSVTCLDGFTVLANSFLQGFVASQQLTGARISAVLNDSNVLFPATRNIATGQTTLQANTITAAALDHLQTVARSENGYLFIARDGTLMFLDRYAANSSGVTQLVPVQAQGPGQVHSNVILVVPATPLTFADDGSGVSYTEINQKSQALLLYNSVTGTRNSNGGAAPVTQEKHDSTSQAQYLIRTLSLGTLENLTDGDVSNLCAYLLGRYSQPDVRFDSVVVDLLSQTALTQAALASLDLVNTVSVSRTPPGSGTPAMLTKNSIVDGVKYAFDVSASSYKMTVQLGSIDSRKFFILNDSTFGLLDSGLLNY